MCSDRKHFDQAAQLSRVRVPASCAELANLKTRKRKLFRVYIWEPKPDSYMLPNLRLFGNRREDATHFLPLCGECLFIRRRRNKSVLGQLFLPS